MEREFEPEKDTKNLNFKSIFKNRTKKSKKYTSKELSKNQQNEKTLKKIDVLPKEKIHEIFNKIKIWREKNEKKAPVDLMGAHHHSDKSSSKNEQAFQFLVGVLLSVQTRDELTDKVMKSLLADGITIEKYYKLTQSEIKKKIKSINFNEKKSKYIKLAVKKIVDEFDGKVPDTLKDLTTFTGIGNKVANIILQEAFGKEIGIAVDVHVHRIANRLKFVYSKTPDETMEQLNPIFEKKDYKDVNKIIVGFGQLLCSKNNPKCLECPVFNDCEIGIKEKKKQEGRRKKRVKGKEKIDEAKPPDIEDLIEEN